MSSKFNLAVEKKIIEADRLIKILESGVDIEITIDNPFATPIYPKWLYQIYQLIGEYINYGEIVDYLLKGGCPIEDMDLIEVQALTTHYYRRERFSPGYLYNAFKDGIILSLLVRYRELISGEDVYSTGRITNDFVECFNLFVDEYRENDEKLGITIEERRLKSISELAHSIYKMTGFKERKWFIDAANRLDFQVDQQFFIDMAKAVNKIERIEKENGEK